jgi:hypothetical protein
MGKGVHLLSQTSRLRMSNFASVDYANNTYPIVYSRTMRV